MELQLIQNKIYELRGKRVMLDFDLAQLYGVETRALKQAVRRNIERFPDDFMFTLSNDEYNSLKLSIRSQFVILENDSSLPKYAPFAFTELGVAMLSSVLRNEKAIQININIMRAFVAMRDYILNRAGESVELVRLRERVLQLEHAVEDNLEAVNDLSEDLHKDIDNLYNAIGALSVKPPPKPRPPIRI